MIIEQTFLENMFLSCFIFFLPFKKGLSSLPYIPVQKILCGYKFLGLLFKVDALSFL